MVRRRIWPGDQFAIDNDIWLEIDRPDALLSAAPLFL
jgi:hypothetical protein